MPHDQNNWRAPAGENNWILVCQKCLLAIPYYEVMIIEGLKDTDISCYCPLCNNHKQPLVVLNTSSDRTKEALVILNEFGSPNSEKGIMYWE